LTLGSIDTSKEGKVIIEVRLSSFSRYWGIARQELPDDRRWEVADGADAGQVLEMLSLPADEALVLLINGRHAERNQTLKDGDILHIFPPIAGG
jgi:molybdopterin converting factor small subunit